MSRSLGDAISIPLACTDCVAERRGRVACWRRDSRPEALSGKLSPCWNANDQTVRWSGSDRGLRPSVLNSWVRTEVAFRRARNVASSSSHCFQLIFRQASPFFALSSNLARRVHPLKCRTIDVEEIQLLDETLLFETKLFLEDLVMLYWAAMFLVIALVAALFGFGGIAGTAIGAAKILFCVFIVLFVLSLIFGGLRRGPTI